MVYRGRSVGVSMTIDIKALLFVDEYAQKNRLSRSMAITELLRLARAYLKVLDAQDDQKADEDIEKPSILIKREAQSTLKAAEWLENYEKEHAPKKQAQKDTNKAKTKTN